MQNKQEEQITWGWFTQMLVSLPRYGRMATVALFSFAIALSVFPIISALLWLFTRFTQNPDIYLYYIFGLNPTYLNALFIIALLVGLIAYLLGWITYVGTIGTQPKPTKYNISYVFVGIISIFISAIWLIWGVLSTTIP